MSKFWGIEYDKWHGILAASGVAVHFNIFWWILQPHFEPLYGNGNVFLGCWVLAVLATHYLQCWYESRQMRDPDLISEYGSWTNFVKNSRRDFKYFWKGILFSWVIPVVEMLFW